MVCLNGCPSAEALGYFQRKDAAPTGLGNFWFGFLQRCRAYGAGKKVWLKN
jgi:hypothetical protein